MFNYTKNSDYIEQDDLVKFSGQKFVNGAYGSRILLEFQSQFRPDFRSQKQPVFFKIVWIIEINFW